MKYSVICVHRNPMPHKRHRKKEKTSSNSNKSCEVWTTVPRALLKSTFFLLKLLLTLISFITFRCVCALDVFFSLCFSTFFIITSSITIFDHIVFSWSLDCLVFAAFFITNRLLLLLVLLLLLLFLSFPSLLFFWAVHLPQSFRIHEPRSHNTTTDQHTQPYTKSSSFFAIIAIIAVAGPFHPQIPTPYLLIAWTRALKSRQVLLGCAATQNNVGTCARGQ